jgi:hypothetical protein
MYKKLSLLLTLTIAAAGAFALNSRPVHPGEVLREDFLKPLGMSANALAKALRVPTPRINDVVRERSGVTKIDPTMFATTTAEI